MKVGVLGAGGMGRTVIEHLHKIDGVEAVVACDLSEECLADVCEHYDIDGTTDVEEILGDSDVPLVFVTASTLGHKPLTVSALEAGKAVMCEKPMATKLADAREMVEAAERTGGFLQIGFELRYSLLYTKVKEWIDQGLLGEVMNTHCYYATSASRPKGSWRNRKSSSGGMFGEKLSHYVDLPRWWVGAKVSSVYSVCAPNVISHYQVRDNYHTTYRFDNGAVSHLSFIMGPPATFEGDSLQNVVSQQQGDGHALSYLVVGTKGAAAISVFDRTIKRWAFSKTPERFQSDWVEDLTWEEPEDHFYFHNTFDQTADIVRRVTEGLPPMTPPRDSYETTRLCFAAEESADTGRIVTMDEFDA